MQTYDITEEILNVMVHAWFEGNVLVGQFSNRINMQNNILFKFLRVVSEYDLWNTDESE